MVLDWTITFGNLFTAALTVIGFVAGALGVVYGLRGSIAVLNVQLAQLGGRMINVETELRDLSKIITTQAVTDQRVTMLDTRLDEHKKGADDWRHSTDVRLTNLEQALRAPPPCH